MYGDKNIETIILLRNVANDYRALDRYDKALPLAKQSADLSREVLGPESPETLAALHYVADCYRETNQLTKALPLHIQLYALYQKVYGATHPYSLSIAGDVVMDYISLDRYEEALPYCYQMIDGFEQKRNQDTGDTRDGWFATVVNTYRYAALVFAKTGRAEEALQTVERSKGRGLADRYAARLADASGILTDAESRRLEKLRWHIAAYNQQLNEERNHSGSKDPAQTDKQLRLEQSLEKSQQAYQDYRALLQKKYPKYRELSEPRIPTAGKRASFCRPIPCT
jgi:tetratricopeptide (TPR) repeat protein